MTSTEEPASLIGKKKFEVFIADSNPEDKNHQEAKVTGHTFVGHTGPFDCSIGNIFQGDFEFSRPFDVETLSPRRNSSALSVLIVDDSVIHRKLTTRALGGLIDEVMWKCESAENGESAMEIVRNSVKIPDVIIIDQNMESTGGRMLGHQVVELMKQDPAFNNVVIIGCTGMSEIAHRDLLNAGCDAVWSKPMPSRQEAQAQIVRFLHQKRNDIVMQISMQQVTQASRTLTTTSSTYSHNRAGGSSLPVFQQVKIARVSYKPLPWDAVVSASLSPGRPALKDNTGNTPPNSREYDEEESAAGLSDLVSVQRGLGNMWLVNGPEALQGASQQPESAVE